MFSCSFVSMISYNRKSKNMGLDGRREKAESIIPHPWPLPHIHCNYITAFPSQSPVVGRFESIDAFHWFDVFSI